MDGLMGRLRERALALGAYRAEVVEVADIAVDASFRSLCAADSCGNYGKNYMCPPDVGDIGQLMAALKSYEYAMVYQTVGKLEDSYDFEGMMAAGRRHNELAWKLRDAAGKMLRDVGTERARWEEAAEVERAWQNMAAAAEGILQQAEATEDENSAGGVRLLHLGAGGCRVCDVCGKRTGEPCRFPEKAIGSLEAYGVNVSLLAEAAGMRYVNGQNTVTYFGGIFCRRERN